MARAHREGDSRTCGATTNVTQQSSVYVNNKLWAVQNDPSTHGNGQLNALNTGVYIENKKVVVRSDDADPDNLCEDNNSHCDPDPNEGSDDVFAYG